MRLLLDPHAFLRWLDGDRRLSSQARKIIGDQGTTVFLSAVSVWEIETKYRPGS